MGLFGILLGLALLVWLAYRGWSILLLAPGAALIAAAFAGGPLLAYWTQTFMDSASRFVAQFFAAVPARGPVWQADGGQRVRFGDRPIYDRTIGSGARNAHCRTGRCARHLWRGQPLCRLLCSGA